MVDKDIKEINAIKAVFPHSAVLLCWFHVLQPSESNQEFVERAESAVHKQYFSNLTELELFCKERMGKMSVSQCAKLIETNPKRLASVITGGTTKY
uniref:MULE transposase domain-containing protein n=1 Tax=Astyanax mexicanus TaxID=7994 RepID=A0A3B1K9U1_ASTMX